MDAEESSASSDDSIVNEECTSKPQLRARKPARGTSKRGRGKQTRTRKVSSDENDSAVNGGQHVSSLKHVGKFRYLSSLNQSESGDEMVPEVPDSEQVTTRGRGRGRGRGRARGRASANHVISNNHVVESPSQVSRSGRRIKPNNRWAPDTDYDAIASKAPPPVRASNRGRSSRSTKILVEQKIEVDDSNETIATDSPDTANEKEVNISTESSECKTSNPIVSLEVQTTINGIESEKSDEEPEAEEKDVDLPSAINNAPLKESSEAVHKEEALSPEVVSKENENEVTVVEQLPLEEVLKEEDEDIESTAPTLNLTSEMETSQTQGVKVEIDCEREVDCEPLNIPASILIKSELDFTDSAEAVCLSNKPDDDVVDKVVEDNHIVSTEPSSVPSDSQPSPLKTEKNTENEIVNSMCNGDQMHLFEADESVVPLQNATVKTDSESIESIKKESAAEQSSAENTPGEEEGASFDSQSMLILPKPVKVKSRWRRTSELEQVIGRNGSSEHGSSCNNSPLTMSPKAGNSQSNQLESLGDLAKEKSLKDIQKTNAAIVEERLQSFEHMDENLYLTSKKTSKEVKRMLCDCTLTKEEIARDEVGCGEDCINRLLMIECGPRCQLASRCTNKRFQKRQYAKLEIFNTEKKGIGLRSLQDLEPGDFIIEYIGEVIDPREFHRRAKEYARDKNKHYYFMALKSDAIIDATQQGNISRFINHSCDPNAETQKWTVNGDLRIGFFVRKSLKAGEELTFDYQFQRYGKEAQRCYCDSANCRGWIGEDPEKADKNREKREKRDREKRRKSNLFREEVNNVDLESEIDKLVTSGVKNQTQTLNLSRLMVRAEDFETRRNILSILRNAEQACRRLFLDYHGLKLLWGWMIDATSAGNSLESLQFKIDLLSTLSSLPVPNKTMLMDSKLLSIVERWAVAGESVSVKQEEGVTSETPVEENLSEQTAQVLNMASQLMESWSNLKEVFRIPKKERLEKMKEHEREADKESWEPETEEQNIRQSSYDRRPNNRLDTGNQNFKDGKMKRSRDSPEREMRKNPRLEIWDNITKEERRRQFALRVAQQDEELRARRCQEDVWRRHLEHCISVGLEPSMTPVNFDNTPFIALASPSFPVGAPQVSWDPILGSWQPCQDETGPLVSATALTPLSESSSTPIVKPPLGPPLLHLVVPKGYNPTVMGPLTMDFDSCEYESSGTPFVPASLVTPLPTEENAVEDSPSTDSTVPVQSATQLPPFWRQAVDDRGRIYYYHVKLRLSQWEPPETSETPDFSSEEEEPEEKSLVLVETSESLTESIEPIVIQNPKELEKAKRRSLLCFERIISPRSEFERSDDAQRYRELKERVLRQKLARIRERGLLIEETKPKLVDKTKHKEKDKRKLNEKEKEKLRKRAKEKYKRSHPKGENRKKLKEKEKVEPTQSVPVVESSEAREEINETEKIEADGEEDAVEPDLMDGSLDDDMNLSIEDEAGEKARNRDVSANTVRKIKDAFRLKISSDIVNILNPYRRNDCKLGRIHCTEDFKHLARKMTHFVLAKELKHCRNIVDLVVNDSVRHKAKDFIKKYMTKFGPTYKRDIDDEA